MIYSLVHYPNIDTTRINQIRRRYDPQFELIQPHVTLMFPIAEAVPEEKLVNHLQAVLCERRPFHIGLQGLRKSSDDYLFLLVEEGKDVLTDLHAHIYTGLLAEFQRTDMPYVPHVTLGLFANYENQFAEALDEAKRLDLNYRCMLDKLHLLKINDHLTDIVSSKEFLLM